jgi:hypothetical protein
MPITLNGDTGIQTPMYNGTITANAVTPSVNMKNRIINGNCVIDQRNAGASVTAGASAFTYTLDRWQYYAALASKFTIQQNAGSVTPPVGFTNYLGVTSSAATSVGSSDLYTIQQVIEGFNVGDLGWGTANAKTITISFWVRSSLTGTFGGAIQNTNSGANRSYPFTYTISAANTWEYETITIAGDTTGTWGTSNGEGLTLKFGLGVGSTFSGTAGAWAAGNFWSATGATSVVGTNGATFYITGVQLEVGSTATSFDYRPYGTELALCQRYYYLAASSPSYIAAGGYFTSSFIIGILNFPTTMRATPTLSATSGTNYYTVYRLGVGDGFDSLAINSAGVNASGIENTTNVSGTAGDVGFLYIDNASVRVAFQAEV